MSVSSELEWDLAEFLVTETQGPPDDYLKMVWCLRLGITASQYDAEDIGTWRRWEAMIAAENRHQKRLRWE